MEAIRGLPTLNPHNFAAWKIAVRAALTERGYLRAIQPDEQSPTKDEHDLYLAELKAWRQLRFQRLELATRPATAGAVQQQSGATGGSGAAARAEAQPTAGDAAAAAARATASGAGATAHSYAQPSAAELVESVMATMPPEPQLPANCPPVDHVTDQRALSLLRIYVGIHYQHLLATCATAAEGWECLARHFERDTHGMRMALRRDLINIQQTERESMEQFFVRVSALRFKLQNVGEYVSEAETKRYIIDGLSKRFRIAGANLLDTVVSNRQ